MRDLVGVTPFEHRWAFLPVVKLCVDLNKKRKKYGTYIELGVPLVLVASLLISLPSFSLGTPATVIFHCTSHRYSSVWQHCGLTLLPCSVGVLGLNPSQGTICIEIACECSPPHTHTHTHSKDIGSSLNCPKYVYECEKGTLDCKLLVRAGTDVNLQYVKCCINWSYINACIKNYNHHHMLL